MTDLRLNIIWSILLSATALTWWLGEHNATGQSALVTAGIVLTLSVLKGWCIIQDFMELRHGPRLWRYLMLAWIVVMASLLFVASLWYTLKY